MFSVKQLFSIVALSAILTVSSAARVGCTRFATVQDGDTCDTLSVRNGVSTFQLANANEGALNAGCNNIFPGEILCLGLRGKDCTRFVVVHSGDTCNSIAATAGIPVTTLLANNPNINSDCTNLFPGEVLCTAHQILTYTF